MFLGPAVAMARGLDYYEMTARCRQSPAWCEAFLVGVVEGGRAGYRAGWQVYEINQGRRAASQPPRPAMACPPDNIGGAEIQGAIKGYFAARPEVWRQDVAEHILAGLAATYPCR